MGPADNPYEPPAADPAPAGARASDQPLLASLGQRLGGATIDALIALALLVPLQWSAGALNDSADQGWPAKALWFVVGFAIELAVHGYPWATRAQSIGKIVAGTRMVTLEGEKASLARIVCRRMLPLDVLEFLAGSSLLFLCLIALADILPIFRADRRCLHDHIAGTRVVRA